MNVPLIGNLLAFILFLFLIYITLYALYLKLNPPRPIPASQRNIKPRIPRANPTLSIGQNDSFPSIFQTDTLDLIDVSIVIVFEPRFNQYHNSRLYNNANAVLNDILIYFQNKNISYEVLIVVNEISNNNDSSINSNDFYINYQNIHEFTIQHPEFKIFNTAINTLNKAWQIASIHTRGRFIFNFSPYEEIPFDIISKYIHKIQSGMKHGKEVLALGSWKPRTKDEIFQTNLSIFSDYILDYMMSYIDMKPSGYHHCFSFMMTREAALLILSNLIKFNSFYFAETLIIADALKMTIKVLRLDQKDDAVIERPSTNKLDEIFTFSLSLILHKINYWKITNRPITINRPLSK